MILRRALSAGHPIETGRGDTIRFYERSRFRDCFRAMIVNGLSQSPCKMTANWFGNGPLRSKSVPAALAKVAAGFEGRDRSRRGVVVNSEPPLA